jgi:hypothetical protein
VIQQVILFSFVSMLVCFWMRNDLGHRPTPLPFLANEPVQQPISAPPFDVQVNDHHYQVEPKYNYNLYGLVVSYSFHDGDFGLHHDWGDYLNVADVCVVWANNAFDLDLSRFEFWSGQFTCNVKTSDSEAWQKFRLEQLSNNHLITEDPQLRSRINSVRIGDQVHIRGMLSHYRGENGSTRGTSITRTDTGNGACETIYVTEFERLQPYTNRWRYGFYLSLVVLVLALVIYLRMPLKISQS